MVGHARFLVAGGETSDELRRIRIARNDGALARFTDTQCFLTEDEGNSVLLPHTTVAGNAVLVQDGANIPTEVDRGLAGMMQQKDCGQNREHCHCYNTSFPVGLHGGYQCKRIRKRFPKGNTRKFKSGIDATLPRRCGEGTCDAPRPVDSPSRYGP